MVSDTTPQLIGYFYLPHRAVAPVNKLGNNWNYNSAGLGEWHFRKKLGGQYRKAPIMSDRLQAVSGGRGSLVWSTVYNGKSIPSASHRLQGGVPQGGEFLFEDGHVEWYGFNPANPRGTIDVGSQTGSWILFYRPANISTNL